VFSEAVEAEGSLVFAKACEMGLFLLGRPVQELAERQETWLPALAKRGTATMNDVKRTHQVVKRTAALVSAALDKMVSDLPEETNPQRALELMIAELTPLQPWFLELIFEDHLFKEAYEAARPRLPATEASKDGVVGLVSPIADPDPEVIGALLGPMQYLSSLPEAVPLGSVLLMIGVRKRTPGIDQRVSVLGDEPILILLRTALTRSADRSRSLTAI
jgi:hypothetical protein